MIKGSERRIVVVERPGDPIFERAVFYVRVGVRPERAGPSLSARAQELCDRLQGEGGKVDGTLLPVPVGNRRRRRLVLGGGLLLGVTALLTAVFFLLR